ncbi:hypothetical protein, partial [Bradyrhizobium sp. STM 3809]|uniref:hypothetical protein n=1 Tax=Bradyrhizobium sp. STM 3809 TaxID=551936 RepID=UPI001AEBD038
SRGTDQADNSGVIGRENVMPSSSLIDPSRRQNHRRCPGQASTRVSAAMRRSGIHTPQQS